MQSRRLRAWAGAVLLGGALAGCGGGDDDDNQREVVVDYATCEASCEYANLCTPGDVRDCSEGSSDIDDCQSAFRAFSASCVKVLKAFYTCMVAANSCDSEGETACGAEVDAVTDTCD